MQTTEHAQADIVVQATIRSDQTVRHIFIKALQAAKKSFSEQKLEEMLLGYRNHGEIPEFVTDYCIGIMVGE